jgi:hypothetical protein
MHHPSSVVVDLVDSVAAVVVGLEAVADSVAAADSMAVVVVG